MTGPTVLFKKRGQRYDVRFAYNPQLVDFCKSVPSWARSYEPTTKTWTFDAAYARSLADDFKAVGCKVIGLEAEQEQTRRAPPPPPPTLAPGRGWAVELMERCSPAVRVSLRRNMAKSLHSDVGGDGTLMQELNDAFNSVEKRNGETG